jgi:molecular chaperone DnaK (HSP70)
VEAGTEHPRTDRLTSASTTRRLVGVDLGTTNSAVVWIDATQPPRGAVPQLFGIPQLVAARELGTRTTLPSFVYMPTPQEQEGGVVALPWVSAPEFVVGAFARDHGALVPARLISSAKSWLANRAVDRRAALLPWTSDGRRISPVDAAARVLMHLRDAWNHVEAAGDPGLRLEEQSLVLTVPASFDEEARELTVDAARAAGLTHLTLLEEPIAAVYAWLSAHPRELPRVLGHGQLLLVCDVGGGTTDFSLIRANEDAGGVHFERVAIGEHLLLGGDNVDVALAALIERKIADRGERLDLTQRQILKRHCSAAKDQLLGPAAPERLSITILGAGRGVVAGAMTTELTREEVTSTVDTFLPRVGREQRPQRHVRPALRELGLPYESDAAITRHLAAFLARSADTISGHVEAGDMVRPDAILFNGGFFTPGIARERILEACTSWFGMRPAVLANEAPQAAVAIGAAFYGIVRHGGPDESNLLIRADSPRSYYVAIEGEADRNAITAVCVLPRGTPEGARLVLDREFTVIANRPVAFTLLSSRERTDVANSIVTFTTDEEVHRHAPLVTSLRYGQRSRQVPLKVRLSLLFTEVGTIELWCESVTTAHRWRLQFNLRAQDTSNASNPPAAGPTFEGETTHTAAVTEVIIPADTLARAEAQLRDAFTGGAARSVDLLIGEIENALGHGKHAWPLLVLRRLADVLLEIADSRRVSARHEARWLNLVGFCMRPGFGTSVDPWRISEIRKVYAAGLIYSKDVQCQVEWLILWQRVSAGFTVTQQEELAARMIGLLGMGARKAPRLNSQMVREAWRLLAGLERLDRQQRRRLGDELIARVRREPHNASFLWAMGRFGARVPAYGPLNAVVPPASAESWLEALRATRSYGNDTYAAVAEIAARTDDPARDVSDDAREAILRWLEESGAPSDIISMVREPIATHRSTPVRLYGEPLPLGLRLDEQ